MAGKLASGEGFTLEDFVEQLAMVRKLGPIGNLLGMLPGAAQNREMLEQVDDKDLDRAAAIVNSVSYDKDRIEPTLDRGFLDATSLAEYLVTKGIPFRTAHHIVGTLVSHCEKTSKHALAHLSVDEINAVIKTHAATVSVDKEVYEALGAKNVVNRYRSAGAAGGKPFEEQLIAWKKRLGI